VAQWDAALGILNQQDPARVQRALNTINRVHNLSIAQQQQQTQQAAERQAQVDAWAKSENARYEQWARSEHLDMREIAPAAQDYLQKELGIDLKDFQQALRENPVLRASAFQRILTDATRYRQLKAAPAKAVQKPVPPVQRPGTRSASPRAAANVDTLNTRLNKSGRIEDAVALLQASRRG
jgi:hypothetical protein